MKRISWIAVVVLLFSSCKMGKNYKGTEFVPPETYNGVDSTYNTSVDTVNTDTLNLKTIDISWWELFNDPVLDSLTRLALENNKDVQIAAETIIQARAALNIQKSNLLPQFDASAKVSRTNVLLGLQGTETNVIQGTANVNWEIDIWGKLRRANEAARADLLSTEYGYRAIMISLITDVAVTYFEIIEARAQLEISKRNAFSRDSMLQIIQARFDKGIVPIIDVNQATIQYTIAAGAVPQYKRRKIQLENAMSILLGAYPDSIPIGKELGEQVIETEIPLETPTELLYRRPDVIAAESRLIAENARVGVAQANRLPSLNASALLGVNANSFDDIDFGNPIWTISGSLFGPLFYWGQLKRQVDIQKSIREQSLYDYKNTMLKAVQEVEDILIDIETTKEEFEIALRRRESALQAQTLSRERYDKGVTSYLEFLEQQRQAFDAELLLAQIRSQQLSNHIRLYKALGGGWIAQSEK